MNLPPSYDRADYVAQGQRFYTLTYRPRGSKCYTILHEGGLMVIHANTQKGWVAAVDHMREAQNIHPNWDVRIAEIRLLKTANMEER